MDSKLEVKVTKIKNKNQKLTNKVKRISGKLESIETFKGLEEKLKKISLDLDTSLK